MRSGGDLEPPIFISPRPSIETTSNKAGLSSSVMMAEPVEIDSHQVVLMAHRRPFFESSSHANYIETSPEASRADLKLRPHVTQAGNGSGIGLITSASGSSGSGIVTGGGCGGNFCGSGSGGGSFGSGSAMQFHSYAFPVVHSGETYRT